MCCKTAQMRSSKLLYLLRIYLPVGLLIFSFGCGGIELDHAFDAARVDIKSNSLEFGAWRVVAHNGPPDTNCWIHVGRSRPGERTACLVAANQESASFTSGPMKVVFTWHDVAGHLAVMSFQCELIAVGEMRFLNVIEYEKSGRLGRSYLIRVKIDDNDTLSVWTQPDWRVVESKYSDVLVIDSVVGCKTARLKGKDDQLRKLLEKSGDELFGLPPNLVAKKIEAEDHAPLEKRKK